jgi:hypothetical protein
MKIRIMLLMLVGAAGVCASFALANDGKGHEWHGQKTTTNGSCQRGAVFGTASGPQTFTVTVTKAGEHSTFAPGQVVTVTVGQSGQPVRIAALGCVNGSAVTARSAFVVGARAQTTTTGTTTTATTTTGTTQTGTTTTGTTTTSTNHVVKSGKDGGGHYGHHHRHHG